MSNANQKNNSKDLSFWMQVGFIIWTIFLIAFSFWLSEKQPDKLWDSFNILNSLIGIFTIILVYFTYKTQKEELRITNETFKKQKEIMEEEKLYNQINFLLQQKDILLEKIYQNFPHKWDSIASSELFDYYYRSLIKNWVTEEKIIKKILAWPDDDNVISSNGQKISRSRAEFNIEYFSSAYRTSKTLFDNYKSISYVINEKINNLPDANELTCLDTSGEEKFCFKVMNKLTDYWQKNPDKQTFLWYFPEK